MHLLADVLYRLLIGSWHLHQLTAFVNHRELELLSIKRVVFLSDFRKA